MTVYKNIALDLPGSRELAELNGIIEDLSLHSHRICGASEAADVTLVHTGPLISACLEPLLEGLGTLTAPATGEESGDAEVLIEVRPVDEGTVLEDLEGAALRRRAIPQAGEPAQRHYQGPSVDEVDRQRLLIHHDALCPWSGLGH